MTFRRTTAVGTALLSLALFMLAGCTLTTQPQLVREGHGESLLERLEHAAPGKGEHMEEGGAVITIESLLTELEMVEVQMLMGQKPFQTLARTDQITAYPCSSCHIEPLADLQAAQDGDAPQAHWDITVEHADESVMRCTTCHRPDNMDTLHTLSGDPVPFDHSYQVCAQCHSGIAKDWTGGAHGKRIGGWAPPRVVNNCVDCHNPHQPSWDIRWPAVTSGGSGN